MHVRQSRWSRLPPRRWRPVVSREPTPGSLGTDASLASERDRVLPLAPNRGEPVRAASSASHRAGAPAAASTRRLQRPVACSLQPRPPPATAAGPAARSGRPSIRGAICAEPGRRWAFGFARHQQPQLAVVVVGWRHKLRGDPVGSVRPRWHRRTRCGCGEGRRRWSAHWPPTADHAFAAAACQHPAGCAAYCSHAASRSGASPRRACATAQRSLRRTCRARRSSATLGRRCPRRRRSACSGHATRTAAHTSTRSTSCGSRRDGPGGHIDRTRRRPRRRGRCNKRCGSACASTGFGRTRRARRNCRRRDRRCTAPAVRRRQ